MSGLSAGVFTGTATATLVDFDDDGRRATLAAAVANMGGLGAGPLMSDLLAQFAPAPLLLPFLVHLLLVPTSPSLPRSWGGLAAPLVGLRAAGVGFGLAVAVLAAVATASFRPTAPRRTPNVSQLHHNSHEVTQEKPCAPSRHTPH